MMMMKKKKIKTPDIEKEKLFLCLYPRVVCFSFCNSTQTKIPLPPPPLLKKAPKFNPVFRKSILNV